MAVSPALHSSDSVEWYTPDDLFETLDAEFAFTLDPCATPSSARCSRYFTRADDGLAQTWTGTVWVNPPYGRSIGAWVRKAAEAVDPSRAMPCDAVVLLIPARTDTSWWHEHVMRADEVRLIRGRLRFRPAGSDEPGDAAPFPSALVVFESGHEGPPAVTAVDRAGRPLGTPERMAARPISLADHRGRRLAALAAAARGEAA